MVSGKPTNMPRSNKHQDGARYLHQRRRTVGSGVIAQFFGRKIAEYERDDLQPQPECGELGPLFCSSGVTVRGKSTTMSQSEKDLDGKRPLRRNRSSVGPGVITRCLRWKIAKCECHVHQPQPECAERPLAFSSAKMELTISTDTQSSQTLIPTSVTRTLCLWKDEDSEFHLTVFREDKDEVFLDLPLSGVLTRKINYDHSHDLWHKVTICESRSQQQRRLVFQLLNTSPDEVKDFNEKLNGVFEKILSTHTEEKEEGEKGWLAQEGRENPAIQYEEGPETRAEVALMQSMSSVSLLAMATSKPHGPSLGTETSSVATGDFSSGLSVMRPYDPLPETTAQQVSVDLAAAIQAGNVKKAQELASVLAQNHTLVSVSFDAAMQERKAREQEISVAVHVEDRESAGLILNAVKVRPSDTIHDLKLSFLGKYGFPPEVQKWIIGKRICKDEETLSKCEVNCSGHTLYLYLLNARAVNISREEYKRQWHSHAAPGAAVTSGSSMKQGQESGVYQSMHLPTGPPLAMVQTPTSSSQHSAFAPSQDQLGGTMRQQSQLSSPSSSSSLTPVSHSLTDLQGNLDPGAEPTSGPRGADSGQGQGQGGTLVAAVAGQSVLMTSGGGGEGRHQLQQPPEATPPEEQELSPQGWQCESCTLINQPTRPGCEACGSPRPANYRVPEGYVVSEEERQRLMREQQLEALMQQQELYERESNYQQLLQADSSDLVTNTATFTCPICFDDTLPGEGVILRECLHQFCKTCLTDAVRHTEEAALKCPFQDDNYGCNASLQDREVRALVPDQVYERYLRRSLDLAESQEVNSYHCKTPDCRGWCIYEDLVNFFRCPVCHHENCLTCRAIHEGMNCKQYQEDLRIRAANDEAAKQTQAVLQDMVEKGEAMPCPKCEVILQKKDGCDWIRCSICKTEICWVTKGPRWGPDGDGDTSGGCKCRVGGQKCHPKCTNCH